MKKLFVLLMVSALVPAFAFAGKPPHKHDHKKHGSAHKKEAPKPADHESAMEGEKEM